MESSRRKSIKRDETKREARRGRSERIPLASSRAIRHSHWLSPKSPPIRRHLSANTRNQFARAQRCFSFLFSSRTFSRAAKKNERRKKVSRRDDDRCEDLANVFLERSAASQLDYRSTIRLGLFVVPQRGDRVKNEGVESNGGAGERIVCTRVRYTPP